MPAYEFKNKDTGEIVTHVMKVSEYDEFKRNNTHLERYISGAPGCSDPVRLGMKQPSDGFKDLLKQIKKNNIHSDINTF